MLGRFVVTIWAGVALSGCSVAVEPSIGLRAQSNIVNNPGAPIGKALYIQGNKGVLITINVKGLPPGKHGMHFHRKGTCKDHNVFKQAQGHIMPSGSPHGYLNPGGPHEGNLPNLIVGPEGSTHVELYTEIVSLYGRGGKPALLDTNGSSLIIHKNTDDHLSQPIGGSGSRIACGALVPPS